MPVPIIRLEVGTTMEMMHAIGSCQSKLMTLSTALESGSLHMRMPCCVLPDLPRRQLVVESGQE